MRLRRLLQLLDFRRTIQLERDLAHAEALLLSGAEDTRRLAESTMGLVRTVDHATGSLEGIKANLAAARDYLDSGRTTEARAIVTALFAILNGRTVSERKEDAQC